MELTYSGIMHCDKCDDTGIIYESKDGGIWGKLCECDPKRKTMIALKKSGLEDSIDTYRFDNFTTKQDFQRMMYDVCKRFIGQNEQRFLFLGGQSGSGKTHLGTAVCGHFINKGIGTIYTTFKLLMNELKSNLNDEEYAEVLNKYGSVPVLYIDDFMKFEPSKSDIDNSFEVINMRAVKNKITIITSERSLDDIIRIDEALGGRIKQRCGEFAMEISKKEGRNYRLTR